MVSKHEGISNKSRLEVYVSGNTKDPSARKPLCQFYTQFGAKHKITPSKICSNKISTRQPRRAPLYGQLFLGVKGIPYFSNSGIQAFYDYILQHPHSIQSPAANGCFKVYVNVTLKIRFCISCYFKCLCGNFTFKLPY